jgi:hypothetical protein
LMEKSSEKRSPLKEKPLRTPGQSLDSEIKRVKQNITIYVVLASFLGVLAFMEWWHWAWKLPPQPLVVTFIAAVVITYSYIKIRQFRKQVSSLILGRDGEKIVGQALEELRTKGYAIFHDVIGKDFNVDHVIVTPNGIFAIETKTRSKPVGIDAKVIFDGEKIAFSGEHPDDKPIKQAIANADWLRRDVLLASTGKDFPVIPVVVFPGWWVEMTNKEKRVWVLNPKALPGWISSQPRLLSQEDLNLAAFHLSRFQQVSS